MAINPDFKAICLKLQHADELIEACLKMDIASYSDNPNDWVDAVDEIRRVLKLMGIKINGDEDEAST